MRGVGRASLEEACGAATWGHDRFYAWRVPRPTLCAVTAHVVAQLEGFCWRWIRRGAGRQGSTRLCGIKPATTIANRGSEKPSLELSVRAPKRIRSLVLTFVATAMLAVTTRAQKYDL